MPDGAGGDLDYFTLESGFVDEFADAAFKLKKGEVSQPVETPFGYHLIQVTDRKEGKLPDFEQNKPYITQAFSMELQKEIVGEERKTAKIDVKPMPKDLFPSEPAGHARLPAHRPPPRRRRSGRAEALSERDRSIDRRSQIRDVQTTLVAQEGKAAIGLGDPVAERGRRDRPQARLEPAVVEVGRDRELAVAVA